MTTEMLFPIADPGDALEHALEARRRIAVDEAGQLDHVAAYVQHVTRTDPLIVATPAAHG